ncbi:S1C family serine protease [Acrocarpospora macrocephala]|uniref:S1C family serine protease n=1 Tax=Acrocarpospora macrocephala TaxID=150177 RepID=UPI001FEB37A1|nr:trypsin-like peptidase domain-containing protein [Acrocarpospora macrocephala]
MERGPERVNADGSRRVMAGVPGRLLIGGGVSAVALVVVLAFLLGRTTSTQSAPSPSRSPTPTATTSPTVSEIFQRVGPSVVVIRTDDAIGTGVIAADNGTIVTANHVIDGAKTINVTFSDGTKARARVASADPGQDIALLMPESLPEILVPAVLGGSGEVGAPVVAIGNPLGLTFSVSSGVVSGLNRASKSDGGDLEGLIQFDASVNPGSSGGPLLDARGLVIGIVVSIADPGKDEAFAGIAFAVPIGTALSGGDGDGDGNGPQI